jgi:hypothetical protein
MGVLSLADGEPWNITIAADPRVRPTDYADDSSYALAAAGGPLGLFSALGGRTSGLLFDLLWRSPTLGLAYGIEEYASLPSIRHYSSSFVLLDAEPLEGLKAEIAFIAYSSHLTLCHFRLENRLADSLDLSLTGGLRLLNPAAHLNRIRPASPLNLQQPLQAVHMRLPDLQFALAWAGSPDFESDLMPDDQGWTLWRHHDLQIEPGASAECWFGLVSAQAQGRLQQELASLAAIDWPNELALHQALAEQIPQVETGNSDWDAAIAATYRLATRCYLSGSGDPSPSNEQRASEAKAADIHNSASGYQALPYPSFVFTRGPERGFPPQGDPTKHNWQWNGQVATEAYVNFPQVLPAAPDFARAVIRNYLHIQHENGYIDWKPGLQGQRAEWDCIPMLAPLLRMVYDYSNDLAFVAECYPGILRHLDHWFSPANDRDQDGFPEWRHSIQSAFDDNPSFVPFRAWAQGGDFSKAESPDLGAYLYREHTDLIALAELLLAQPADSSLPIDRARLQADIARLRQRAAALAAAVESMWNEERAIYNYRDRDSHSQQSGRLLLHASYSDDQLADPISLAMSDGRSEQPQRIVIRLRSQESPAIAIKLYGRDAEGQAIQEQFEREDFGWWGKPPSMVSLASNQLFSELERVEISGLRAAAQLEVAFIDYTREDQTLMLPLWAGIPSRERAAKLIEQTLCDPERFWRAYGIPNCSAQDPAYKSDNRDGSGGVWMMWNTMLGEALCDYGYYEQAWELFGRIVAAQVRSLRDEKCFYEAYDNDTGEGLGSRDYLWGTVPLHFFTKLHGIQIVSPRLVRLLPADLRGRRIQIQHHGVTVIRYEQGATIRWPDGRLEQLNLSSQQPIERLG